MSEKVFLISGKELAAHTQIKQEEAISLLENAAAQYPNASLEELLNAVRTWLVTEDNYEESWDYQRPAEQVIAKVEEVAAEVETYSYEPESYEPVVVEEQVVEEEQPTVEETYEEPEPEVVVEEPVAEEEVVIEDDEEEDEEYNEEDIFANQVPIISRQRRWKGLLTEAAKLDR